MICTKSQPVQRLEQFGFTVANEDAVGLLSDVTQIYSFVIAIEKPFDAFFTKF